MPKIVMEESKGFELIPEDSIIDCTLTDIQISLFEDKEKGETRKNLNWTFVINTPGEWETKRIWGNTSMVFNTNPNCKLRNWSQSVLGVELDAGYALDTDDLIGRKVRVAVGHKDGVNKQTQQTVKRMFVADVLPAKKSSGFVDIPPF